MLKQSLYQLFHGLMLAALLISALQVCHGKAENEPEVLDEGRSREKRLFSLFNIVTFRNEPCVLSSDNSLRGSCMTQKECQDSGGRQDGNCAAGFGACCLFTSVCGRDTQVNKNCTYLQNAEYPLSASPSTQCSFTFNRICPNLCQIRLDFENFETAQPPSFVREGDCTVGGDTFTATSPTGVSPPVVCGTLTGQHMYIETGPTGTAGSVTFDFGATTGATRTFNVKVTYYTCDNLAKAPADCVQYFTDLSGTFSTYNFQGDSLLINQDYNTCFRQAEGYCGIEFSDSAPNPDPFDLSMSIGDPAKTAGCSFAYITIPQTNLPAGSTERLCGNVLNSVDGATVPGTIISDFTGMLMVGTFTAGNFLGAALPEPIGGYNLDFTQIPC